MGRICDRICTQLCPFRQSTTKNAVYRYVIRKRSKTEVYNPIQVRFDCTKHRHNTRFLTIDFFSLQYYFNHNKAPPFHHKLINVDCNNLRAPKDYPSNQLPNVWAKHTEHVSTMQHTLLYGTFHCCSHYILEHLKS